MKFFGVIFFVGLICATSAKLPMARLAPLNTINQHFIDFIHNERVNFPCGWPDSGIDPIEPFHIEDFNFRIESNSEFTAVDFNMFNADATGHKHLWINDFDLRIAGLIMTFNISIARQHIVGDHRTSGEMGGIVTIPISGQGRISMDVNDVLVLGTGQLNTLPGGYLNLNRFISTITVGTVDASLTGFGALDGPVSRMISSAAPDMVNDSQDFINDGVNAVLVPAMNRFLNQHTLVTMVNLMADRNQNPPPRRCFW